MQSLWVELVRQALFLPFAASAPPAPQPRIEFNAMPQVCCAPQFQTSLGAGLARNRERPRHRKHTRTRSVNVRQSRGPKRAGSHPGPPPEPQRCIVFDPGPPKCDRRGYSPLAQRGRASPLHTECSTPSQQSRVFPLRCGKESMCPHTMIESACIQIVSVVERRASSGKSASAATPAANIVDEQTSLVSPQEGSSTFSRQLVDTCRCFDITGPALKGG